MPDAELGAHPVVLGGGGVQLQRGRIEGGEQLGEAIALLVELGLVVGRSPSALGVGGRGLGLSHGYLACTGLSRGKTGEGRSQPKGGDFKRPLRIVQVFVVKKWPVGPITDPPL